MDAVFFLFRLVKPVADVPRRGKRKRRVERHEPAVIVHEFAIGEEPADVRIAIEVVFYPGDRVLRSLPIRRIQHAVGLSRRFVVGDQHAD